MEYEKTFHDETPENAAEIREIVRNLVEMQEAREIFKRRNHRAENWDFQLLDENYQIESNYADFNYNYEYFWEEKDDFWVENSPIRHPEYWNFEPDYEPDFEPVYETVHNYQLDYAPAYEQNYNPSFEPDFSYQLNYEPTCEPIYELDYEPEYGAGYNYPLEFEYETDIEPKSRSNYKHDFEPDYTYEQVFGPCFRPNYDPNDELVYNYSPDYEPTFRTDFEPECELDYRRIYAPIYKPNELNIEPIYRPDYETEFEPIYELDEPDCDPNYDPNNCQPDEENREYSEQSEGFFEAESGVETISEVLNEPEEHEDLKSDYKLVWDPTTDTYSKVWK